MLKTSLKPVFVIIIIIFIITQFPVTMAEQYGTIQGRALDKDGNGIAGVSIKLQNGDCKTVATAVTGADGSYSFDRVPSPTGADIYRLLANFNKDGKSWDSGTAFFEVLALRITTKDIHFNDYPPSGMGCLYGVVTSDQNMIIPVPATIYLDNGMFIQYAGGRYDTWNFEQLPQGEYVVWAETNIGSETYTSIRYNVTVLSDQQGYLPIYLPTYIAGTNKVAYHSQPQPMKNLVHGVVLQKNGISCAGARVDLYQVSGSSQQLVSSTTANESGQYVFDYVDVRAMSQQFLVRVTVEAYGTAHSQDSGVFTVYYPNTLGVQHDISVPVSLNFANSGSLVLTTIPSGARISVDGVDTHYVTPCDIASLPAGIHSITLSHDDYYNDDFTVEILPDMTLAINRTLKTSTGASYINVKPAGAAIYIDGEFAGTSPLNLTNYPAGSHMYTIACNGYRNESGTIEIFPGEMINKEIDMVAVPGISLTYIGYLISSLVHQIFNIL
ncbi:MAG: PEGA domain protein [Methanocella sp. PtaU1.Bin125]|nr:MAG: PEGA domain protein [Methanocella sp. PtaU1.Bin125]